MAVRVSTLSEFLLARIAEDEAAVNDRTRHLAPGSWSYAEQFGDFGDDERWMIEIPAARVLAECEAKRRIVGMHEPEACWSVNLECAKCSFHEMYEGFNDEHEAWPCPTLRLLALPYRDHSDYQQEWAV